MNYVLHIVWKDMRALWWELSAATVATLGMAGLQFAPVTMPLQTLREVSPVLAVLAWALLVVQLVQVDALVGTEHDWRTRPIRRRDLVLAKVLFVAIFVGLPMVVGDAIVLMGNGFAPLNYVPGMLGKMAWLVVVILLPAAALGAITRTVPQALLAALGTAIVVGVSLAAVSTGRGSWGGADWVRGSWLGVSGTAVAVGVLWLQFGRHRIVAARALAVGGTALAVLTTCLMPWAVGFGVQRMFATQTPEGIKVVPRLRVILDSTARLLMPVSVVDLPEGYQARVLRGQATVEVNGAHYATETAAGDDELWLDVAGQQGSPARIRGRVWLAILAPQARQEFAADEGHTMVSGLGDCAMGASEIAGVSTLATFSCQYPYRLPALSRVTLKPGSAGKQMEPSSVSGSYAPMPSELMMQPITRLWSNARDVEYGTRPDRIRVVFETWTSVAYVERSFALDVKRLGDYVTGEAAR